MDLYWFVTTGNPFGSEAVTLCLRDDGLGGYLPNRRARSPFEGCEVALAFSWHEQRWDLGMPARVCSIWRPHPAHVALLQRRHVTFLHIVFSFLGLMLGRFE